MTYFNLRRLRLGHQRIWYFNHMILRIEWLILLDHWTWCFIGFVTIFPPIVRVIVKVGSFLIWWLIVYFFFCLFYWIWNFHDGLIFIDCFFILIVKSLQGLCRFCFFIIFRLHLIDDQCQSISWIMVNYSFLFMNFRTHDLFSYQN